MQRFPPRTLFGQLVLGTILVQSLFLAVFVWYTVVSQRELAREHTHQRMLQQLNQLSAACAKPLALGDMTSVHDVLQLSRIAPTIDVARVTDLRGNTLSVTENGRDEGLDPYEREALPSATKQQVFRIKNGQLEGVTPIPGPGKPVALLWLEPNHALSLNTLNTVLRVSLSYGLLALLANLAPTFLVVRSMTRPLRRLGDATKQVVLQPILNTAFPLPVTTANEAGELTASFNAMVRELDEQRSGLLETLALLDSMLGNAPIGFAFFDQDLRHVRINALFAELYQEDTERCLGRRSLELQPGPVSESIVLALHQVFETGQAVHNVELTANTLGKAESYRRWLAHFYPVRPDLQTTRWVGVIAVEITERLKTEETLRRTEKLAATGRLAASIAHEINNPLEAVTNLLYLLETDQSMEPVAAELVRTAQAELARVSEITQQTLRFHRQQTRPQIVHLAELVAPIVNLYQQRLTAARIVVANSIPQNVELCGYLGELRQLFANLVGNAADAMPDGGTLFLRARRSSGRSPEGAWRPGIRVAVADTGVGMSPDTLHRIFEAFFTTKQATGTGLGLWVSQEIVQKHAGTVRVRSRQGALSGTVFLLFFPEMDLEDHRNRRTT